MLTFLLLAACAGPSTKDASDDSTAATAGLGLPVGASTWTGTAGFMGASFGLSLELDNSGGDLSGEVTLTDDPDAPLGFGSGTFSVTGTHEPGSGRVALAPEDWIERPEPLLDLLGLSGAYDPDADTITGLVADYASPNDNTLSGGPVALTRASGDGAPLDIGAAELALTTGRLPFSGTMQCTGAEREMQGELVYDGAGGLSGHISYGDLTLAEATYTFEFTGVHNPSTGGITLVPGLYTAFEDGTYRNFFVEATFDPASGEFDGEGRINSGSCPDGTWQAAL